VIGASEKRRAERLKRQATEDFDEEEAAALEEENEVEEELLDQVRLAAGLGWAGLGWAGLGREAWCWAGLVLGTPRRLARRSCRCCH
jgi:hypothetical protein